MPRGEVVHDMSRWTVSVL